MSAFASLVRRIRRKENVSKERASAIAAAIGRRKYGKRKFQAMAVAGKRKARRGK